MHRVALFFALAAIASVGYSRPTCSATFCGTFGSSATCQSRYGYISCAKYATTKDALFSCARLSKTCSNSCYFIPVYGSDGKPYCTPCHLHVFSCKVGFKVYGPIAYPPLSEKTSYYTKANTVRAVVRNEGTRPATKANTERAAAREEVTRSATKKLPPQCSMIYCTARGALSLCTFKGKVANCYKFSTTEESKKQCDFECPDICFEDGPFGSDGEKYCSLCHLRLASCGVGYKIYGPAKPIPTQPTPLPNPTLPVLSLCSMQFCTSKGEKARCVDVINRVFSTCGKWASTPEKKKQCAFACPLFCLPDGRPFDNTGREHCSGCQLQSASCAADFRIFGPIEKSNKKLVLSSAHH